MNYRINQAWLTVALPILLTMMFTGCGFFGDGDVATIVGDLGPGFAPNARALGGGSVEELWLVRLDKGSDSVIYPGTVSNAEVFLPGSDGRFEVSVPDSASEVALLAARPSEPSPKDQIVAVLSFRVDADSGSLILPAHGLSGTLNMGSISFVDGEGVSSLTVDQSPGVIPAGGIGVLRQIADVDNSVKLLINDHVNYHGQNAEYYTPEITLGYSGPTITSIMEKTADAAQYSFTNIEALVFSEDSDTQLTLRSPTGVGQGISGNYGANSAAKWSIGVSGPTIEEGWWQLLDADTSEVIAEYDLAIGFPLSPSGEPLSLVPLPSFQLDDQSMVTGMAIDWVASNGSGAFAVSDPDALETMIGKVEFWVQPEVGGGPITYMFDEIRGDQPAPRMHGDLTGFEFVVPFDSAATTGLTIGFRFGFYRVSVSFQHS